MDLFGYGMLGSFYGLAQVLIKAYMGWIFSCFGDALWDLYMCVALHCSFALSAGGSQFLS